MGGIWAAQEWAWNVFPSTDESSAVVVGCLAVTVMGAWWGSRGEVEKEMVLEDDDDSDDEREKKRA